MELDYVLAENKYGKYAVPKSSQHRPAAQKILNGAVYEPDTIQYMIDNCGNGSIIHAGTYFGDFLPALGNLNNTIFAFEPMYENYCCALTTLSLNFDSNNSIKLFNAGLSDHDGLGNIVFKDERGQNLGGTSRISSSNNETFIDEINLITIDNNTFIQNTEHCSIIQLDVEGHEEKVLKGALETIKKHKPILILECWNDKMFETEFFKEKIFGELGYKEERKLHENKVLIP